MKKILLVILLLVISCLSFAEEGNFYTLSGETLKYSDLLSSSETVLFFWTTWCPTCARAIQQINNNYSDFSQFNILYINGGQNEAQVNEFIKAKEINKGIKEKIILDKNLVLANKFSVFAIPTYIFFKKDKPVYRSHYISVELITEIFN